MSEFTGVKTIRKTRNLLIKMIKQSACAIPSYTYPTHNINLIQRDKFPHISTELYITANIHALLQIVMPFHGNVTTFSPT